MKTHTITSYSYEELSDAAKEKALEWFKEVNAGDTTFSDAVIEEAKTIGKLLGLDITNVFWTGFSSEKDGACFESTWSASRAKLNRWEVKEHAPEDMELQRIAAEFERIALVYPEASFNVKHSGLYAHSYCAVFDVTMNDGSEAFEQSDEDSLVQTGRDFMDWIYRSLKKENAWQDSDEYIASAIIAKEHQFTIEGKGYVCLN